MFRKSIHNQCLSSDFAYPEIFLKRGDGAQGRNRTTDTAIFSRMLYQLSYLGGSSEAAEIRAAAARSAVYKR